LVAADNSSFGAFVFKHRGALLAAPAVLLTIAGKPTAGSIALGLPLALAGELLRCCAVGFSGTTTRGDVVTAPQLVTAGPYAHVRNPLYVGNFVTAAGFAIAFTGGMRPVSRFLVAGGSLALMFGVYSVIVPHEENYLRGTFGDAFDAYAARVPRVVPQLTPAEPQNGTFDPSVIRSAETKTFATFGLMLAALAVKALR
jgi:protein-S-isoprenylcysteine O-methyltransferase Ste14